MRSVTRRLDEPSLLEACHQRSVELLQRNLAPEGILAASPGARARARGYTGDIRARRGGLRDRDGGVRGQASGGRSRRGSAHLGAAPGAERPDREVRGPAEAGGGFLVPGVHRFDAVVADRVGVSRSSAAGRGAFGGGMRGASSSPIQWLLAQEHQRFFLLQQNEASDWADIMPRSGFVLYIERLWYFVKRLYGVAQAAGDAREFQRTVSSVLGGPRGVSPRPAAQ